MNSSFNGFEYIKKRLPNTISFYRENLTKDEKHEYDRIVEAIINYNNCIKINNISVSQIEHIFDCIKLDNPLLFYVESLNLKYLENKKQIFVYPVYRFDKEKTNNTLVALLSKCKKMLISINTNNKFDVEKTIHDEFCKSIVYDHSFAESSYECVGPLLFKKGVCEGISKAVKVLCDILGIFCIVVHGKATQNIGGQTGQAHTWNKIQINKYFYNLDVTFDLTISSNGIIRYDYFNLSDDDIVKDHYFDNKRYPICNNKDCYYLVSGQTFSTLKDIKEYYILSISNSKKSIVLRISNRSHFQVKEREIIRCFNEALIALNKRNQPYQYSFNKYQNVMQIDMI